MAGADVARRRGLTQRQRDLLLAPLCEAGLLFVVGAAAWLVHRPLFFASLGPTAFEITETPERPSARTYNVVVGHLIGLVGGFVALWVTRAWGVPVVSTHDVPMLRVWASVVATLLTVSGTVLFRATQPAALATTLLVATGSMQQPVDAAYIMGAILLMALIGEPMRRWRLEHRKREEAEKAGPGA